MANKLSKSSLPDSQDETRAALERLLTNKSKHFTPGTYVWRDGQRWMVSAWAANCWVYLIRGEEILRLHHEPFMRGLWKCKCEDR